MLNYLKCKNEKLKRPIDRLSLDLLPPKLRALILYIQIKQHMLQKDIIRQVRRKFQPQIGATVKFKKSGHF